MNETERIELLRAVAESAQEDVRVQSWLGIPFSQFKRHSKVIYSKTKKAPSREALGYVYRR